MSDKPCYESASDFLLRIKQQRYRPMPSSTPNVDFQRNFEAKLNALRRDGMRVPDFSQEKTARDIIVDGIWSDIKSVLPICFTDWAGTHLAVGTAEHMAVNAVCARSPEGFYAILVHHGLLTLFNKVSKIVAATTEPAAVTYCNRDGGAGLTRALLMQWYLEVAGHYRETRIPLGPQILLSGKADRIHAFQLAHWERLIFCHELGHLFCGHLESLVKENREADLAVIDHSGDSVAHDLEHEADIFGYLLVRRRLVADKRVDEKKVDQTLLGLAMTLFDLLYLIGGSGSKTHPDGITRLLTLVATIYGREAADLVSSGYDDHSKLLLIADWEFSPDIDAISFADKCRHARKIRPTWN